MANILSNNPFRTPQLSPQNTNASINSRAGVGDTPISPRTVQNVNDNLLDSFPDEPPPPYTLSADTLEGEIPTEPFQESPLPDIPSRTPNSVPANVVQPSIVINNQPERSEARNPPPPPPPPPPRHPSTISTISPTNTTTSRRSASISSPTSPISPVRSRSDRLSVSYLPPSGPPPSERTSQIYDPPSSPPPRRAVSASSRSVINNNNNSSNNNVNNRPMDDGRPTTTPVPGHPLLLQNKLLVYPLGYECTQCKNVGYRNNDPSHPCTKCWSKYARSYSGALAYAPFPSASANGGSSSSSSSNFQRPLPKLQPPHGTSTSSPSSSRPATQNPQQRARLRRRSQSESKLNGGNFYNSTSPSMSSASSSRINANTSSRTSVPQSPVASSQRPATLTNTNRIPSRPSPHAVQPSPQSHASQRSNIPTTSRPTSCISTRPPPRSPGAPISPGGRAIVYQAGDPRLGGRLCWRCDGRGSISYFLFDSTTCEICGGIGRTFN